MTLYSNFFSSAINSVGINEKVVKITYSSNLDKVYEYKCENIPEFSNSLCSVLTSNELLQDGGSVGKFIHKSRREKVLVDI